VRHRQTRKGRQQICSTYCHRATPRLYQVAPVCRGLALGECNTVPRRTTPGAGHAHGVGIRLKSFGTAAILSGYGGTYPGPTSPLAWVLLTHTCRSRRELCASHNLASEDVATKRRATRAVRRVTSSKSVGALHPVSKQTPHGGRIRLCIFIIISHELNVIIKFNGGSCLYCQNENLYHVFIAIFSMRNIFLHELVLDVTRAHIYL